MAYIDCCGRRGMAAFDSSFAGQPRPRFPVLKKICERDRQILGIGFETGRNGGANILFSVFRAETSRQMAQQSSWRSPITRSVSSMTTQKRPLILPSSSVKGL